MNSSVIIWTLIGISFTTYFVVSLVYKRLGINNLQTALLTANGLQLLNLKHLLGIVFFGALFYLITPELRFLINTIEIPRLYILLPFLIVFFLSAYLSNLSVKNYDIEKMTINHYNFSSAWLYFSIRFTFLFFYEFFFRGIVLFKFLEHSSLFFAILYSTILYVLIHVFDSKKELLGTIPFGIVLCLFAYFTNSIWYVFLIHLALSAVYEISIFYYQTLKI